MTATLLAIAKVQASRLFLANLFVNRYFDFVIHSLLQEEDRRLSDQPPILVRNDTHTQGLCHQSLMEYPPVDPNLTYSTRNLASEPGTAPVTPRIIDAKKLPTWVGSGELLFVRSLTHNGLLENLTVGNRFWRTETGSAISRNLFTTPSGTP